MPTLTVPSSGLREGDIVFAHGLRVLLDRPVKRYPSTNSVSESYPWMYRCDGLVLNRDEVTNDEVPMSFTERSPEADRRRGVREDERVEQAEHRWAIQGNDLAMWSVER